jgi:hypothetical protein
MKTLSSPDFSTQTGEQLLLMRILRPRLKALIDQELDRRAGWRRLTAQPARPGLAAATRVA